jgi:hypothetical protein
MHKEKPERKNSEKKETQEFLFNDMYKTGRGGGVDIFLKSVKDEKITVVRACRTSQYRAPRPFPELQVKSETIQG